MIKKLKDAKEKGAIIVFTALLLPLMMICVGLAIDFGNVYVHYTRLQNAADAAALAGARAFAASSATDNPDVVDAKGTHNYADSVAKEYAEENAKKNNLKNDITLTPAPRAREGEDAIYYRVDLSETVPLYFLRILGEDFKEWTIGVNSVAAIAASSAEGYEYENGRDLFIFRNSFDAVNTVNNPDTDKKGQISNTFDGNVAFTDGSGSNANNETTPWTQIDSKNPDGNFYLTYSTQKEDLKYFFSERIKKEDLSIQEAIDKGYDYAFPSIFEDYDMAYLAAKARSDMGLPEYVEDTGWPAWDGNKYKTWEEYTAVTNAYTEQQNAYKSKFKLTTDNYGYYKNLTSEKLSEDLAISANNGDGNVNVTIDSSMGSSTDPVYLYLDPTIYFLGIDVNANNNRPLIVVYTGTGSVHINISGGTTFSGVFYAPKSNDVLINAGDAVFEGTIIAGSMSLRGDNGTYRYKDFIDGQSAKRKTGGSSGKAMVSKGSKVNLVSSTNVSWD